MTFLKVKHLIYIVILLFVNNICLLAQTVDEQIKLHKQWVAEHTPKPEQLTDEELIVKVALIISSISNEPAEINLIKACGKWDKSIIAYANHRSDRMLDKGYTETISVLRTMEKIAIEKVGINSLATAYCRYSLACIVPDIDGTASLEEINKCLKDYKVDVNSKNAKEQQEYALLFESVRLVLTHNVDVSNPNLWPEIFRLEKNVAEFYADYDVNTTTRANTYQMLGALKGCSDYFISDLIEVGRAERIEEVKGVPKHVLYADGQPTNSESYYKMALETGEKAIGRHNIDNLFYLYDYAYFMRSRGVPTDSIYQQLRQATDILEKYLPYGNNHAATFEILRWSYNIWFKENLFELASYKLFKDDIANFYGKKSSEYVNYLFNLIDQQYSVGNPEAKDLLNELISIVPETYKDCSSCLGTILIGEYNMLKAFGYDSQELRDLLDNILNLYRNSHAPEWGSLSFGNQLALLLTELHHKSECLEVQQLRLQDLGVLVGENSMTYADDLTAYARNFDLSQSAESEKYYLEAISISKKNGKGAPYMKQYLADLYFNIGDYAKGLAMMNESIDELKQDCDTMQVAISQIILTSYYLNRNVQDAIDYKSLYETAIPVILNNLDAFPAQYIYILQHIADYYCQQNRFQEAVDVLWSADALYIARGASNENYVLSIRKQIADIYMNKLNQYDEAVQIYDSEIARLREADSNGNAPIIMKCLLSKWEIVALSNNIYKMLTCLSDISQTFLTLTNFINQDFDFQINYILPIISVSSEFFSLLKKSLEIEDLTEPPANYEKFMEEYIKMNSIGKDVTAMRETLIGKKNLVITQMLSIKDQIKNTLQEITDELPANIPDYEHSYLYYDIIYNWERYYRYLEPDNEKCAAYIEQILELGKQFPSTIAYDMMEALDFYFEVGNENKVDELLQMLKDEQRSMHLSNYEASQMMNLVMTILHQKGQYEKILPLARENNVRVKEMISQNFDLMSPSEREEFINRHGTGGNGLQMLLNVYPKQLSGEVYDEAIYQKGLLMRSSERIRRNILKSGDKQLLALMDSISFYKTLSQSISTDLLSDDQTGWTKKMELTMRIEHFEHEVTRNAAKYLDEQDVNISWKDVQKKLKKDEAAVEITFSDSILVALVLKPGMEIPKYVELEKGYGLYRDMEKLTGLTAKGFSESLYSDDVVGLYRRLWEPLDGVLKGCRRVYLSPCGYLSNIAFHAIKTPDGKALIDHYDIFQLTSTAELVKETKQISSQHTATVYGGIYYDQKQAAKAASIVTVQVSENDKRSLDSELARDENRGTKTEAFRYLPGPMQEENDVSDILSNADIKVIKGLEATEDSFNAMDGNSPNVIHLATHGFFVKDVINNNFLKRFNDAKYDSMLRSGLALANANDTWNTKLTDDESQDGILTARDISKLDLSNTDIMVVSACETALGTYSQEGVYGIQRGIKQAGVKSMIASLWKVNDASTAYLMSLFYSKWSAGTSKHEAMLQAIKQTREKYPSPYNWAPFVMIDAIQ